MNEYESNWQMFRVFWVGLVVVLLALIGTLTVNNIVNPQCKCARPPIKKEGGGKSCDCCKEFPK